MLALETSSKSGTRQTTLDRVKFQKKWELIISLQIQQELLYKWTVTVNMHP